MPKDKTGPQTGDSKTNPISRVESRVIPSQAVKSVTSEPRLVQAHRTLAALVASSNNPPLKLKAEFDVLGIGRLRTSSLENFALVDNHGDHAGSFTLSFEYHGREPLKHVCESERVYTALRKKLFDYRQIGRAHV